MSVASFKANNVLAEDASPKTVSAYKKALAAEQQVETFSPTLDKTQGAYSAAVTARDNYLLANPAATKANDKKFAKLENNVTFTEANFQKASNTSSAYYAQVTSTADSYSSAVAADTASSSTLNTVNQNAFPNVEKFTSLGITYKKDFLTDIKSSFLDPPTQLLE